MGNGQFDRLANGQILRLDVAVEADVDISNLGHGAGTTDRFTRGKNRRATTSR